MVIIEAPLFTKLISGIMSDDDYRLLQDAIMEQPEIGNIITGSGGLRKVRWGIDGKGKRGGARIIYYWVTEDDQIYMLYIYKKSEQADLKPDQVAVLKQIVEWWT